MLQRKARSRRVALAQIVALPVVALLISAAYWGSGLTLPASEQSLLPPEATVAASQDIPSPVPSDTPTPAPSHTPEPSPTPTATATSTATPTPTATATYTPTPTPTSSPTATPTATQTPTPTPLRPTPDGVERTVRVPILMYHHIDNPPPGADAIRYDLSVRPQQFEEQLHYLQQQGYESITLNDLALHVTMGKEIPPRPVIITFDDGYVDAYTHAFPLLQRYGYVGTFFLISAYIDDNHPDFLSWEHVKEMHAAGMRFEPHSYNHPDMRNRGFDFVVFQILAPKEAIEARTGETCRFFAYPLGRYDDYVIDVLRSAHYWGGVLTEQGATHSTDDLFTLRRVRVHGGEGLDDFIRALNLDW